MKRDIILSGVGGQGILSIAAVIGRAALEDGLHIKQAEVHGMSQRGGDVQSNLRIGTSAIRSDLIPRGAADLIGSMEPMAEKYEHDPSKVTILTVEQYNQRYGKSSSISEYDIFTEGLDSFGDYHSSRMGRISVCSVFATGR